MLIHVGIYAFVTLFSLVSTISESYVLSTGPTKRIFVAVTFLRNEISLLLWYPGFPDAGGGKKGDARK